MRKRHFAALVAGLLVSGGLAIVRAQTPDTPPAGQTQAPASAPAPAPPPPSPGPLHQWGTDFSFLFDGYVDKNFNDPPSGFNGLRNFDVRSDTAHVNMGMITIDHAPAPVGFHLDVGFGETFDVIHSGNRDPGAWEYFKQAYISVKPKAWHGIELDAGEFVTSAGAEVIETNQNFNYSRSLLFAWAIPYSHTGFRLQYAVGAHFTGSVQVVNGWNNVEPINSGKTIGVTGTYAWKKVTWNNNYYVGPEHPGTTTGWRNLYDTSIAVNPTDKLSYYVNFDYGRDKNIGQGASQWTGLAGAARYAIGKNYAIASRLEFFDDIDGFSTGTRQNVKEFTLTGEYKMTGWLMARAEFRTDWSDKPFFEKNNQPSGSKTQPTALLGLIAYLAPKK
ncbi:MAG TPA: porin [Bryobacteraceae bacterium]|nr:porin [Bryobacteraceae bacterium]